MKRGPAVDREINQKYANDKKMSTKEKEVGQKHYEHVWIKPNLLQFL